MQLEGIDGLPCYVRGSDIVFCASGSANKPTKLLQPTPRHLVHANGNPSAAEGAPAIDTVPVLVLSMRGHPQPQGVADTAENREKVADAMDGVYTGG